MSEPTGKRPRRRRGGRGGQGRPRPQDTATQQQSDAQDSAPPPEQTPRVDARGPRQDTRGRGRGERPPGAPTPPGPPGPGGRTHRSPSAAERPRGGDRDRPPRTGERERPQRGDRSRESAPRDRGPRAFEVPVPQDERSIELGAAFKEAQILVRDAKKALAKRKAEFSDEPDWMLEQLAAAEQRFEAAATEWAAYLETTGRKVVRGDRR